MILTKNRWKGIIEASLLIVIMMGFGTIAHPTNIIDYALGVIFFVGGLWLWILRRDLDYGR